MAARRPAIGEAPVGGDFRPGQGRPQAATFLAVRLVVITLFLGGTIVYQVRSGLAASPPVVPYLYLLVGFSYLHAVVSGFFLPVIGGRASVQQQIIWDLLLATSLIYLTGGIDSLFSFLYLLIIIAASAFLRRRDVFFVACASAILYGSLLDLQYYGYLPLLADLDFPTAINARDVFFEVFVNVTAFLLVALLGGTLSNRLRRSQEALEQKEFDYEELDILNRAILGNINTGIMVVNSAGRIRLFNQAAERMTGYPLREVYNVEVRALFPEMHLFESGEIKTERRGEAGFFDRSGEKKILGYASSKLPMTRDERPGLLVVFQDLTAYVAMEERLKRADRLAAVGRLAAGMAHEIRNPLASISGSVQLLMEEDHVTVEDRRLMGIVVREADRLSDLLTDFLLYARPADPAPESFDPAGMIDELADLLAADERFSGVRIQRRYASGSVVYFDREQLRQLLWDLLVNGAEAMPEGGVLTIELAADGSSLSVTDNGPGITGETMGRIFEPFFTTKTNGTGLGLATAHSLAEANSGRIDVESAPEGGARFVLRLPRGEETVREAGASGNA